MVYCNAKHTSFQPSQDQWRCPKCGSETGLVIDESDPDSNLDCDKVHKHDFVQCFDCGYEGTGLAVTKLLAKQHDMVTCPCCKGTGAVKREKT